MLKFLVTFFIGYIFGSKAGEKRYQQIKTSSSYLYNHPLTKALTGRLRERIAEIIDPTQKPQEFIAYPQETKIIDKKTKF